VLSDLLGQPTDCASERLRLIHGMLRVFTYVVWGKYADLLSITIENKMKRDEVRKKSSFLGRLLPGF
jgi:hypothetical protein